jgi:hypothetical protein
MPVILKDKDGKDCVLDAAIAQAIGMLPSFDANGAVFFQRELEHIKARSYDVKYADLKAREVFPVSNEAGAGVTTITYRTYDQAGSAKIINAYADDLPRADVAGKETTIPVRSVGAAYGYNIDEINASQLTGVGLDQRRANASMRSVEQKINDIAFYGDAAHGLPGFFSNPNIPTGDVVNPGSGTEWINKSPDEILFDINDGATDIFDTTKMVESGKAVLLPPQQYSYIASTPRSANSDTTILAYVVANSPYLTSMDQVKPLNECAAVNNPLLAKDAMVWYDPSPEKLELEIPLEMEFMAAQMQGLEFIIPGRARVGGVNVYYPLSANISTGI